MFVCEKKGGKKLEKNNDAGIFTYIGLKKRPYIW